MPYYSHAHKKTKRQISHLAAIVNGCYQIFHAPLMNFFIIFIIAFVEFLPVGFYVFWHNIEELHSNWNQSAEIILYLKKNIEAKTVTELLDKLKLNSAIIEVKLITPHEGMQNFVKHTGFGEILFDFKENPLPNVILVQPKLKTLSQPQTVALIDSLKNHVAVENVKVNMDWIEHSQRALNLWQRLTLILSLLFTIGAVIMIGSTAYITPQIITKKTTIPKRALQYQCIWHSLFGSLLTLLLINFILLLLRNTGFILQGLGLGYSMAFILLGILLSVIASSFAIRKQPLVL